ncbi:hypothetical protein V0288_11220 [Pannus brasiliensis CCIBt3594]|uniref:Uncharacterized protein n=1 Tax=Pannus brasiliensis CCIBt3594 TaxID=1427578 RepID=A0AAW9QL81_9CHRO
MTPTLGIPPKIVAGDSVSWSDHLPDYPPSAGYELNYAIRGASGMPVNVTATIEGGDFLSTLTPAQTADLAPGAYYWQAFVTRGINVRITVGSGRLEVAANLATADNYDGRSEAERELAEVRKAIAHVLSGGQSYKIHEREFTRADLEILMARETQLRVRVAREKNGSSNVKIRFR